MNKEAYLKLFETYIVSEGTCLAMLRFISHLTRLFPDSELRIKYGISKFIQTTEDFAEACLSNNNESIAENLEKFDIQFKEIMNSLDDKNRSIIEKCIQGDLIIATHSDYWPDKEFLPKVYIERKIDKLRGECS